MKKTNQKIHTLYVKDLLKSLDERNMGTAEVVNLANRICGKNKGKRKSIVKIAMKDKISDAWNCIRKERHEEQEMWRELKQTLRQKNKVQAFNEIWAKEKDRHFKRLRDKRKKKVLWIKQKFYRTEAVPDVYRGIRVGDQNRNDEFSIEPVSYGGVSIDEDEKEILVTHPKFSVFLMLLKPLIVKQRSKKH